MTGPKYLLHDDIYHLFARMLHAPKRAKIFTNTCDDNGEVATKLRGNNFIVSATLANESDWLKYQQKLAAGYGDEYQNYENQRAEASHCPDLTMLHPVPQFHYAFSCFPTIGAYEYGEDGSKPFPVETEDTLLQWSVSKQSPERRGPMVMMLMEQAYCALQQAGYYGIVLPKKWSGKYMEFVNKWMEDVGLVAKVELPQESLYRLVPAEDSTPEEPKEIKEYAPGTHVLFIYHKPYPDTNVKRNQMEFATQRYRCFVAKLKKLDDQAAMDNVVERYWRTEWNRYSSKKYRDLLVGATHGVYNIQDFQPLTLPSTKDIRVLKVAEINRLSFKIYNDLVSIGNNPMEVRVIPTNTGAKIKGFSELAISSLSVLRSRMGIDIDEMREATKNGRPAITRYDAMLSKPLRESQSEIQQRLTEFGLIPCMWANDLARMERNKRWLSIQMAPIERTIRVPGEEEGQSSWEKIYDDVSVQAAFPEVWGEWVRRALKMKLNAKAGPEQNHTFEFQFEDIVTMACKQSCVNANVPGLGKTRETLFVPLLRGCKKFLIISPVRLIGVWQNEIETTMANFQRQVRRDWRGQLLRCDYRIIKYAKDCLPENLAMFNIISYNDMSKVPGDALFFECPQCKFRICSPYARYKPECRKQYCPRCNHGVHQKDKQHNKENGLRKYKTRTGIVDDRVSTGKIEMMACEDQYPKLKETKVMSKEYNPNTREYESKETVIVEERGLHLKWTFANLLRNTFTSRAIDEANNVANPNSNRSTANDHACSRSRYALTGTPMKGYPKSMVGPFNFTHKRVVFPNYRAVAGNANVGLNIFVRKYTTFVHRDGKTAKALPKISQPEIFQQEMAPLMLRHVRHEPNVAKCIPPKTPELVPHRIEMDPEHRAYYERWLEVFAEWWMIKRQEVDKKDAKLTNDLLVKLGYLVNASSIPHFMTENLGTGDGANWAKLIGPYNGPPVAKMVYCMDLLQEYAKQGDKSIVFCWRKANVRLGRSWCQKLTKENPKNPLNSLKVTGDDSNEIQPGTNRSQKQMIVDKFCNQDYQVLWATTETLKEGFNIPQANHGIFVEYTWQPQDTDQGVGRMIRPGQKKEIRADFLVHKGTVDEYVAAINMLKGRSASEGIDYEEFNDLTSSMIPDFMQYANSIVDGTEKIKRTEMWLAIEELRKKLEDYGEDTKSSDKDD